MKVGILGTGDVAKALGKGFLGIGSQVMMGSREAGKAEQTGRDVGPNVRGGTFADTTKFADTIVLATLGTATENAIQMAGVENFGGKLVLDTTNPLDLSQGMPPKLIGGLGSSAGEKHQKLLPKAHVVKVFNTVGNALMYRPNFFGGVPDMFICGNNAEAKKKVGAICTQFGWGVIDVGDIATAHYLEAMCLVWVLSALQGNHWHQAFKLLR